MPHDMIAPASGVLGADGVHRFPIRVYYADTDALGVVYHGTYFALAERARTELLELHGLGMKRREELGIAFAIRSSEVDYRLPARLGETVIIETQVLEIGGASFRLAQRFRREGRDLVTIFLRLVCIDRRFQAVRLPDAVRAALSAGFTPASEGVQS